MQSLRRGLATRLALSFLHSSAALFQSAYRRFSCQTSFRLLVRLMVSLQSLSRRRVDLLRYRQLRRASNRLRSWRRRLVARRHVVRSAVHLQRVSRGHLARQRVLDLHLAALLLQRRFRSWHESLSSRRSLAQRHHRATLVAAKWRGFCGRWNYLAVVSAAATVQRAARGKLARIWVVEMHMYATIVQAIWRGYCGREAILAR